MLRECYKLILTQSLSLILLKKDLIDSDGKLTELAKELFILNGGRKEKKLDLNLFDCYRAEIILTEFLTNFSFLANYNLISIGGIEYHNMLGNNKPPYIHRLLSTKSEQGVSYQESLYSYSHSVILTDAANKHFVNLFPFIVDYNSLKPNTHTSDFLFYLSCDCNENDTQNNYFKELYYRRPKGKPIKFSYDDKIKTYNDTLIRDERKKETPEMKIEQYNINRLMDSLRIDLQTTNSSEL